MHSIGIDMGGTKIAIGLFDSDKELVKKTVIPTDVSLPAYELSDGMIREIKSMLSPLELSFNDICGIGIGCPSTVNFRTGIVNNTNNIPHLSKFPLKDYFENACGVKTVVDNDANLAALAEYKRGAGIGHDNMMYCTASTGIGGGFILGGKLYRGAHGYAGESGHTIITPHTGILCGCGNRGCIESYASGAQIDAHARERIAAGEKTVMTELAGGGKIDGKILAEAFYMNDRTAAELLGEMAKYIGILLFNIYQILNVDCFVIGGGLAQGFGTDLLSRIKASFESFKRADDEPVYFKPAALKEDFGIVGACEVLFE